MAAPSKSAHRASGSLGSGLVDPNENRVAPIRPAFQALLDPASSASSSPLCLVTSGGRSQLVHELSAWATACGLTVFLRDGSHFGAELQQAIAANRWARLRERMIAADMVVIEHVEAIGGPLLQSSFRHLFDAATTHGTRFCLTLDKHPATGQLSADLAGRLTGGLVIPLSQKEHRSVPAGHAAAQPATGTAAALRSSLGRQPSLEQIFAATARHYGIAIEILIGPSRSRTVCHARGLAMYLARQLTDRSFSSIGQACGNRDHTTALHGTRTTFARIGTDPVIAADAEAICQTLQRHPPRKQLRSIPAATLSTERRRIVGERRASEPTSSPTATRPVAGAARPCRQQDDRPADD